MRFSVWPNPQQPWQGLLDVAGHAESTGWDGVWFADHFMPLGDDVSQPTLECWSVLGLGAGWQENEHEAYGIDF